MSWFKRRHRAFKRMGAVAETGLSSGQVDAAHWSEMEQRLIGDRAHG